MYDEELMERLVDSIRTCSLDELREIVDICRDAIADQEALRSDYAMSQDDADPKTDPDADTDDLAALDIFALQDPDGDDDDGEEVGDDD